jgi:hypothetical protein
MQWSPLLGALRGSPRGVKGALLSWRDLFQLQAAEARRAWRDESEYALVIAISTSAEAGLPRESMSGGHLLPFRVPRHAGEEGAAVVAPLASVPHQAIASPLNDSASPSYLMDAVWLSLLRRRDGAVLQLSGASSPLELRSSSGLTGSAGARKSLTLLFESEDDEYAQLKPPTPRGGRRSLKHDLSRRGISAQRGHQPVRVALRYALLPKAVPSLATLPGVTGAEDEGKSRTSPTRRGSGRPRTRACDPKHAHQE